MIVLENVEEFQTWGPLLADGKACPKRKGQTFGRFVGKLRSLGYVVDWRELRACDYGAPTIRKRLFLIARCDGRAIVWPEPTHGAPGTLGVASGQLAPWRTAAECLDFSLPCPSIFERKRPLAEATLRRIARGLRKFVIESADPFIVKVNHGVDWFRGQAIDEPMQTLTGKNGYGLAIPHGSKFRTGSTGSDCGEPLATITAGKKENAAGNSHAMGLVNATLTPFLTECANASEQRIFAPDEPMRTQCAQVKGGHFAMAAATLVQTGYGERDGQQPRAPGLEKPLGTVVAGGVKHAAVAAFLAKHYSGEQVHASPLDAPVHTVTATDHNALVTANLMVNTSGHSGGAADAPTPTVTTGNHIAEVRAFLIKYYGQGGQDQSCAEPMHTVPCHDRIGLVTIKGEEYVIADIGMRMLEPHELFAAQGFPANYIIAPVVSGRRLPKHAQVRMCGNSVCPPLAAAIVAANVPEMAARAESEEA